MFFYTIISFRNIQRIPSAHSRRRPEMITVAGGPFAVTRCPVGVQSKSNATSIFLPLTKASFDQSGLLGQQILAGILWELATLLHFHSGLVVRKYGLCCGRRLSTVHVGVLMRTPGTSSTASVVFSADETQHRCPLRGHYPDGTFCGTALVIQSH